MKKLLAAVLLFTVVAMPAFASNKMPRAPRQHYDYKYKPPKYHKPHNLKSHRMKPHHAK
jgi:hypothetical protein